MWIVSYSCSWISWRLFWYRQNISRTFDLKSWWYSSGYPLSFCTCSRGCTEIFFFSLEMPLSSYNLTINSLPAGLLDLLVREEYSLMVGYYALQLPVLFFKEKYPFLGGLGGWFSMLAWKKFSFESCRTSFYWLIWPSISRISWMVQFVGLVLCSLWLDIMSLTRDCCDVLF